MHWEESAVGYQAYHSELCCNNEALADRLRRGAMVRMARFRDLAERYEAILFDAFGVLNLGVRPIAGASEQIAALQRRGIPFHIVSNNASQSPQQVLGHFQQMGFHGIADQQLTTSGMAVIPFLAGSPWHGLSYYLVGTEESRRSYCPAPTRLAVDHGENWREARLMIFCSNRDYRLDVRIREEVAWLLAERRLPMILANPDFAAPDAAGGLYPVAGSTAAQLAVRHAVAVIGVGKPFAPVFNLALQRLNDGGAGGIRPERVLMVGDTLGTDILGGAAMGFDTCLTLSGVTNERTSSLEQQCQRLGIRPDYVVTDIGG